MQLNEYITKPFERWINVKGGTVRMDSSPKSIFKSKQDCKTKTPIQKRHSK